MSKQNSKKIRRGGARRAVWGGSPRRDSDDDSLNLSTPSSSPLQQQRPDASTHVEGANDDSEDHISRIGSRETNSAGSDASMANMLHGINLSDIGTPNAHLRFGSPAAQTRKRRAPSSSPPIQTRKRRAPSSSPPLIQTRKRRASSSPPLIVDRTNLSHQIPTVRPTARRAVFVGMRQTTDDIDVTGSRAAPPPTGKRQRTRSVGGGRNSRRRRVT